VFGHEVATAARGRDLLVSVGGGAGPAPAEYRVPSDPSAAVFPRALAALHGRPDDALAAPGLDPDDAHPDRRLGIDLARLRAAAPGARVVLGELGERPDTFPALCVVAAARPGETELRGAAALRGKESDRIAAMARALAAAGAICRELDDGLWVRGPLAPRAGAAALPAPADHRVVMALALLGTVLPAGVVLEHGEAVAKSWPSFFDWLGRVADVTYGGTSA
jgi:3-phosphoshikimate 1-carboxyvinyltransferase